MTVKICRALVTGFVLLVAGCSVEHNLKLDARLPLSPAVNQMPLHIGVYYSPEFAEYTKKCEIKSYGSSGLGFYIFPVGSTSRDLFDQVIASMFISVTRTSAPSQPLSNISSLDGLLEPRIESFDWDTDFSDPSFVKFRARVSYVINLYNSPDGCLVTSMHAEGQNTEKAYLVAAGDSKQRVAAEQAMRNAMAKFVIDFQEQPEVKRWCSTHASVPGNHQ